MTKYDFYVVGIGASAGGLEALNSFFDNMKPDNNMAFVIIQHLSPDYKSLMLELLSKHTSMKIFRVEDAMEIQPNSLYLIPPKKNMRLYGGKLYLSDPDANNVLNLPIDIFFKSLADDCGEMAIGIILSGTGTDGTRGIRAIKEAGGMVVVQDDKNAKFDGMPRSAIGTGLVDFILPAEQIPEQLISYTKSPVLSKNLQEEKLHKKDEDALTRIFDLIKNHSGIDFTHYKQSTVLRRIEQRMGINQIDKMDMYLNFIFQNPQEINTLYKQLLIGVTKFFRDTECFEQLEKSVIPLICDSKSDNSQIRVWTASCSTGEEAYSIAILFLEHIKKQNRNFDLKFFATDIDKEAIEYASVGLYPESISADVPMYILEKYFVKLGEQYQISREVRELIVFAQHNLINDPPFNKMDLISCRNFLIYLQPVLQQKVLSFFHFALNQNAFLFLGNSETVGDMLNQYFINYDAKNKIFRTSWSQTQGQITKPMINMQMLSGLSAEKKSESRNPILPFAGHKYVFREQTKIQEELYRILMRDFMPPCIIVEQNYQVVMICGGANEYLKLPVGQVQYNILKMLRTDMSIIVGTALRKVFNENEDVFYKNINIKENDTFKIYQIKANAIIEERTRQKYCAITIIEEEAKELTEEGKSQFQIDYSINQRIKDLEQELQYNKENLQATIEELETSNEELQSSNEELLSANEELQSTNEELQSVNEELITVNSELQMKIQELTDLNNDMDNFLSTSNIGTIFLDRELKIRKFTPAITNIINIKEQDIGRPISDISTTLKNENMLKDSKEVLINLQEIVKEVQNNNMEYFLKKIAPYKTSDGLIKGVVITFIEITHLKKAYQNIMRLNEALSKMQNMIAFFDEKWNFEFANDEYSLVSKYSLDELKNTNLIKTIKNTPLKEEIVGEIKNIKMNSIWSGELDLLKKDEQPYRELATIYFIEDDLQSKKYYMKISRLIPKIKKTKNKSGDFSEQ